MLDNFDRFPKLMDFKYAIRQFSIISAPSVIRIDCKQCEGAGYIMAININNKGEYVFRCNCRNGATREIEIPIWGNQYKAKWVLREEYFDTPQKIPERDGLKFNGYNLEADPRFERLKAKFGENRVLDLVEETWKGLGDAIFPEAIFAYFGWRVYKKFNKSERKDADDFAKAFERYKKMLLGMGIK
jgi:hypothetical protein